MRGVRELIGDGRCREDLRQFLWFGVGYAVVLVLGYLLVRQINLSLSETEMGRFSYVVAVVSIAMPILYLTAPQAYLRFHDNHRVSPGLRKMLLPLFCLASAGVAFLVWLKSGSWIAVTYAAYPFFNERLFIFRSQMRTTAVNTLKIAELFVPLVALLMLNRLLGPATADHVLAFYGLGYLMCFAFPLLLNGSRTPSSTTVFRFLVPLTFASVVTMLIENMTVVVVKSILGYEAAAQMGVATRNLMFTRALFTLLMMFYPVLYFREMDNGRFRVVGAYRLFVVAVAVLFSVLMMVGTPILYRMTGASAYARSSFVFVLLTGAILMDFLSDVFTLYFQHEIRTWKGTVVKSLELVVLSVGFVWLSRLEHPTLSAFGGAVLASAGCGAALGIGWSVILERRHIRIAGGLR